jgi:hypothetical protein
MAEAQPDIANFLAKLRNKSICRMPERHIFFIPLQKRLHRLMQEARL